MLHPRNNYDVSFLCCGQNGPACSGVKFLSWGTRHSLTLDGHYSNVTIWLQYSISGNMAKCQQRDCRLKLSSFLAVSPQEYPASQKGKHCIFIQLQSISLKVNCHCLKFLYSFSFSDFLWQLLPLWCLSLQGCLPAVKEKGEEKCCWLVTYLPQQ